MRAVAVDHVVPVADMAGLLSALSSQHVGPEEATMGRAGEATDQRTELELEITAGNTALGKRLFEHAELTPYSCPECHGVLAALAEDERVRFRCHTGHAYSAESLLASFAEDIEENLYCALRGFDESVMLLDHVGDHLAENNDTQRAAAYFRKAQEVKRKGRLIRDALAEHRSGSIET